MGTEAMRVGITSQQRIEIFGTEVFQAARDCFGRNHGQGGRLSHLLRADLGLRSVELSRVLQFRSAVFVKKDKNSKTPCPPMH